MTNLPTPSQLHPQKISLPLKFCFQREAICLYHEPLAVHLPGGLMINMVIEEGPLKVV